MKAAFGCSTLAHSFSNPQVAILGGSQSDRELSAQPAAQAAPSLTPFAPAESMILEVSELSTKGYQGMMWPELFIENQVFSSLSNRKVRCVQQHPLFNGDTVCETRPDKSGGAGNLAATPHCIYSCCSTVSSSIHISGLMGTSL